MRRAALISSLAAAALLLHFSRSPSNDRDWSPDVMTPAYADIHAGSVTVRNIRSAVYRTEKDYDVRHYDASFRLADLRDLDLFLCYWGPKHIAHAMLSFGFADGRRLCFSIETRREKGEEYSAVKGFFRNYELFYVVADERDVVRLRTAYRAGEDVYLFRVKAREEIARAVFLDYLAGINRLAAEPRWYNALTTNCAVNIWRHVRPHYGGLPADWRILASGHAGEMLHELGLLDTALPFGELRRRSHINAAANAAGDSPEFSRLIRRGLPGFGQGVSEIRVQ